MGINTMSSMCTNVQDSSATDVGMSSSGCHRQRRTQPLMPNMSSRSVDRRPRQLIVTDFAAADTDAVIQHFKVLLASQSLRCF